MASEAITRNDLVAVINNLLPIFYPVGSYYETSDTTFNPNTEWGGTWELETSGQVHVSAGGTYAVAGALTNTTDGGSTDVPYHNHSVNSASAGSHTHGSKSITGTLRPLFWTTQQSKTEGIVTVGSGNKDRTAGGGSNFGTAAATINATHEHTSVTVTMPEHNTNYAGTSGNNNLPPYIVVNRWHRTA